MSPSHVPATVPRWPNPKPAVNQKDLTTMLKLTLSITLSLMLSLLAAPQATAAKLTPTDTTRTYSMPLDKVWAACIAAGSVNPYTITTADKASGILRVLIIKKAVYLVLVVTPGPTPDTTTVNVQLTLDRLTYAVAILFRPNQPKTVKEYFAAVNAVLLQAGGGVGGGGIGGKP